MEPQLEAKPSTKGLTFPKQLNTGQSYQALCLGCSQSGWIGKCTLKSQVKIRELSPWPVWLSS